MGKQKPFGIKDKLGYMFGDIGTFKEVFTDRAFLGMILSALFMLFATLMGQGLNNYLFADYFNNTKALSVFSILALPATLILLGVSTPLTVKFGKKECGVVCFIVAGVIYLLIAILKIKNVWLFIGISFIAIIAKQCFSMQAYALAAINYDSLAVVQTEAVKEGIYQISALFPAISYLLCALVLAFIYPLNRKRVEKNAAELECRAAGNYNDKH